jgi:outer membrane protein OmpA-like peptidoglycan-associated protein
LSFRRAAAVREELQERGVSGANITVAGRGGLRPAFSNNTADGRENNRRVEFAVW